MQLIVIKLSSVKMDETGTAQAGGTYRAFGRFSGSTNYEDNGIGWLLLSVIDALEKDTERLRVISQIKSKCEIRRSS